LGLHQSQLDLGGGLTGKETGKRGKEWKAEGLGDMDGSAGRGVDLIISHGGDFNVTH